MRDVDNGTRHAADEYYATGSLAIHEVTSHTSSEEVGAVDVDAPELSHTIDGVFDGVEVLGEAGRGNEVVDLSVLVDDIREDALNRGLIADCEKSAMFRVLSEANKLTIAVVSGDLGHSVSAGVLVLEDLDKLLCLFLSFLLCDDGVSHGCVETRSR